MTVSKDQKDWVGLFARIVLAGAFLSAVADRFSIWGPAGTENVFWGNWQAFVEYTAVLNPFAKDTFLLPFLAATATILEIVFAFLLIVGIKTRWVAWGSGALLCIFALAMSFTLGVKAPWDYSVWSAAGAAFLLAAQGPGGLSLDSYLSKQG